MFIQFSGLSALLVWVSLSPSPGLNSYTQEHAKQQTYAKGQRSQPQ